MSEQIALFQESLKKAEEITLTLLHRLGGDMEISIVQKNAGDDRTDLQKIYRLHQEVSGAYLNANSFFITFFFFL